MPRLCSTSLIRIAIPIILITCILLYHYSDSTALNDSLKSIQDPVVRFLDYNEYVKQDKYVKQEKFSSSDFAVDTRDLLEHIHRQCKLHGLPLSYETTKKAMPNAITIHIPNYNIVYVSNPKTGSTSFKKFVLRLQGDMTPYDDMEHVHRGQKEKYQVINRYTKNMTIDDIVERDMYVVGFVRNPITRLISGFKNKVLRTEGGDYNRKIYQILPETATDIERFRVFVELVTSGVISDHHFTPQWDKMRVCSFPYSLLGQTETTRDSIETLMMETGIVDVEFPGSRSERGAVKIVNYIIDLYSIIFFSKFCRFCRLVDL